MPKATLYYEKARLTLIKKWTKHYIDKNNHIKMLQKFHLAVTKYLTQFSKNQFQTFSYIHRNLREALKWNWEKLYLKLNNNSNKMRWKKKEFIQYIIILRSLLYSWFFSWWFSIIIILINRGNMFLHPSEFLHSPLAKAKKKSSLGSRNRPGEIFFITYPLA